MSRPSAERVGSRTRPPVARVRDERLALLVRTLGGDVPPNAGDLRAAVEQLVGTRTDRLWLAHAVVAAELPTDVQVAELQARATLHGPWAALTPALASLESARWHREVRVRTGAVTCDVHAAVTSASPVPPSDGARIGWEVARRWAADREVELLAWTRHFTALRPLDAGERDRLLATTGPTGHDTPVPGAPEQVVVPWGGTHLVTEVASEPGRSGRLLALARHCATSVAWIGHDVLPITAAGLTDPGTAGGFVRHLAAVRRSDRVAMASPATEQELRGWIAMGAGRRDPGPDSAVIRPPRTVPPASADDLAEAVAGLAIDPGTPMVLAVGDGEPRANRSAVLHAAERLWLDGHHFDLVLVGPGSGRETAPHDHTLEDLVAAGRPVRLVPELPDRLLGAAYRLAHCTLLPSLHDAFGLSVAASLAAGTPVVTSAFGTARDVTAPAGEPWGALLVDPRNDDEIVEALRTMLDDAATHQRLREETTRHPGRSWDEYADELWAYLVQGVRPKGAAS